MEIEERLDFIEFRMDLLREGTEFCKFLYDCNITSQQLTKLYEVMEGIREKIDNGEKVSHSQYEAEVLGIVDHRTLDYHFCELLAKLLWEEERYEEVFPALYKDSIKYQDLFK